MASVDTFPRQYARTQRLTLGEPRDIQVSKDGQRVLFLRSASGSDAVHSLWMLNVSTRVETLCVDPRNMQTADDAELPAEERARRERLREGAAGITSYAGDDALGKVVFTLGGTLYQALIEVDGQTSVKVVPLPHLVFDARLRPNHNEISYINSNGVWVTDDEGNTRRITPDEGPLVTWGMAEFAAAEEMGRYRGYWWSPNGDKLAICRADNSPLSSAWISNATNPESTPTEHRYPFAGTANSVVEVFVHEPASGALETTGIRTGSDFEYISSVQWRDSERLVIGTLTRDQKRYELFEINQGNLETIWLDTDSAWVELVPGSPCFDHTGKLVVAADRDGRRCLIVDGEVVTPASLQVRSITASNDPAIVFAANDISDPTQLHVHTFSHGRLERITTHPGVHSARVGGDTFVVRSANLHATRASTRIINGPEISNLAEDPLLLPNVTLHTVGANGLHTALVLPAGYSGGRLPVLCDPYGGPHAQRVLSSQSAYLSAQWFADQGFAVVITDGRGTPGRGSMWERAVHLDVAQPVLEDQVEALHELAESTGALDLTRVAIRGWSFGGYLAALAVLRRPDVFHCGIAGAPVTEWRLYDTCYTERYLGNPSLDPAPYDATSLLPDAKNLTRPLLLIHGLSDDNVLPAHTFQLSNELLAAGRMHEVLPLSGVSHMTPQEVVAENLLLHQLEFMRRSLNL